MLSLFLCTEYDDSLSVFIGDTVSVDYELVCVLDPQDEDVFGFFEDVSIDSNLLKT